MSAAPVGSGRPAAIGASSPALPVTSIPDPARCEVSFASFPVIFQWTFAPHMTRSPLASVSWAPFTMPAYFCVTKMDFVPCPSMGSNGGHGRQDGGFHTAGLHRRLAERAVT